MKIKYSNQAQIVIRNLKSFDHLDFEKWLLNKVSEVGDRMIFEYIFDKEIKNGDIK